MNPHTRLIDEALVNEPIKNSFRLGWEFITLNRQFTLISMAILIGLNILAVITGMFFFFTMLVGTFGLMIRMHIGRVFYATATIESYIDEIKSSRVNELFPKFFSPATGAYTGWLILMLFFIISFIMILNGAGLVKPNMSVNDLVLILQTHWVSIVMVIAIILYIQPLVQARIIQSENFKSGFVAVFSIFSIKLWKSSFQREYFRYVIPVALIMMGMFFVLIQIFSIMPPIGNMIQILFIIISYFFIVMFAIISMMAQRISE